MSNSKNKQLLVSIMIVLLSVGILYFLLSSPKVTPPQSYEPASTTLSGTYTCLPHLDTSGPQTQECAFGIKTDDGVYYAVNLGTSADAMNQFQSGEYVTAEGFVVIKEALSSDQWAKYNMKGIFTVTKIIEPTPVSGKLNIDAVCNSALAYMTFPNDGSAEVFIAECKEGKHPEVIERYKKENGFDDGAVI